MLEPRQERLGDRGFGNFWGLLGSTLPESCYICVCFAYHVLRQFGQTG